MKLLDYTDDNDAFYRSAPLEDFADLYNEALDDNVDSLPFMVEDLDYHEELDFNN